MTLNFINNYPIIKNWLVKQIGYYSKSLYSFNTEHANAVKLSLAQDTKSRVIIVAKCHYTESWQSISSVNKNELNKVLTLKKSTEHQVGVIFQAYKNNAIDGYDVKTIKIDQTVIKQLGETCTYIPETELFVPNEKNQLLQIETPAGLVFCSQIESKIKTTYAKGIINNIETYKLSVGLSENIEVVSVSVDNFSQFLLAQLFKLKYSQLPKVISFDIKAWFNTTQLHLLYWAPLLTALAFYLVLNGYFYIKTNELEQSLVSGGNQVGEIISKKNELDNNLATLAMLSEELNQQPLVHQYWQVFDDLLTSGMDITRISYKDNNITIRGEAEKASSVLSSIAANPLVTAAAFEGPVRKSRDKDSFVLTLQVKEG